MPNKTKKEHNCSRHTGSRWHNFHFSGKLIVCSVIFGLMLILIGGIVMAIGMDRDDDTKSDDYDDFQKKPPMAIVGPVIMGIGGFTVIVGVFMFLVETNVCRGRTADASPLIEGGESRPMNSAASGNDSDSRAIPSTSHHTDKHRHGNRKKSSSPRAKLSTKKLQSSKDKSHETSSSGSTPSSPITVSHNNSKNFLSASDKFVTPQSSFEKDMHSNSRDAENQTSTSLMKSFTSSGMSWNVSTEFQTPDTSFRDNSMSLESSQQSEGMQTSLSDSCTPIVNSLEYGKREFLTPKNSYAETINSSAISTENQSKEILEVVISSSASEKINTVSNNSNENTKIKHHEVNLSGAAITASVEEVIGADLKNRPSSVDNSSDRSEEDIAIPLLKNECMEYNELQTNVVQNIPETDINAEMKETEAKHCERVQFDALLKPEGENEYKDQDLQNDYLDHNEKQTRTTDEVAERKKYDINNVLLKEPDDRNLNSEEINVLKNITDENNAEQAIGDNFKIDSDTEVKNSDLIKKVKENESDKGIDYSIKTISLNSDGTKVESENVDVSKIAVGSNSSADKNSSHLSSSDAEADVAQKIQDDLQDPKEYILESNINISESSKLNNSS